MASSPAPIRLHLRGPFRVVDADGRAVSGLSRRGQALLAYLACQPGQRAERAILADLLWGERAEEQARSSLRQELSGLRRALPDGTFDADRQQVWLTPGAVLTDEDDAGEVLQGFDLKSEPFEDWLRLVRAQETPAASAATPALPGGGTRARPALAVLRFDELARGEDDFFADGVVEEITGALSRSRDVDVIARQSAFALGGATVSHRDAGAALGVDYLVEGSVRRAGGRVRISVQLVSAEDGHTLWSESFDDRLDDLFALQDRIAAQVAGRIAPNVRSAEIARAGTRPPADRTAYELVLSAYPHFWSHRREGNERAKDFYGQALARDPEYPLALAMKAWCHAQQAAYVWTDTPESDRGTARDLAERAASLAGDHAPTLVAICAALSLSGLDQTRPKTFIDRALAIDPNSAWGWLRSGWLHCLHNEPGTALEHFDRAERLSPLDPFRFNMEFGRANARAELGDFDAAVGHMQTGMSMAPQVTWAWRMLAAYHAMRGDDAAAHQALATYLSHYPGMTIKRLKATMPPAIAATQHNYYDGLRRAGVPEE